MEDFIAGMVEKVGIDREQAESVIAYLEENADKVPELLGKVPGIDALKDKLPGGMGGLLG